MKALIVGFGSIGSRHARLLTEMGCQTAIVSRRTLDVTPAYDKLETALRAEQPEYVVVANKTSDHVAALNELAELGYSGTVLVEKPLFEAVHDLPRHNFRGAYVAYNLRFHPVLHALHARLQGEKILSVQAYVGQYLPQWRPVSDYRHSYSAKRVAGGGALRDLSHDLDYLQWLFGPWRRLAALGGHYSRLEIDSDDLFALMIEMDNCPVVVIQLNYLDRVARREIVVNTEEATFCVDLIAGTLQEDREPVETFSIERDDTYREQHAAILQGRTERLCTLEEGLDLMQMIEAAEQAVQQKVWVAR